MGSHLCVRKITLATLLMKQFEGSKGNGGSES